MFILCLHSVMFHYKSPPPDGQAISALLRHPACLAKAVQRFEFVAAHRDSSNEAQLPISLKLKVTVANKKWLPVALN